MPLRWPEDEDEGSAAADDISNIPTFVARSILDEEPVSINKAYTVFRGEKKLTKAGKAFKDALSQAVSRATFEWKRAHQTTYQEGGKAELHITLFFPDLYNKTWTKGGKVKTRYKKKDASNYLKLIEDAVSDGSGIDDCFNLDLHIRKRHSDTPRVEVVLATYVEDPKVWAELMEDG